MATDRLKVIVFGAGEAARRAFARLSDRVDVLAVADNDPAKQGASFMGVEVIAPARIRDMPYHCIVVASVHAREITAQLLDLGVSADDIELPPSDQRLVYETRWIAVLWWMAVGGALGAVTTAWLLR